MNFAFTTTPEQLREMEQLMLRLTGSMTFICKNYNFGKLAGKGIVFMDIKTGDHIFKITKDQNELITFLHSSPGTGTRVATINFSRFLKVTNLAWQFYWHPDKIAFRIDDNDTFTTAEYAQGQKAPFQIRLADNGQEVLLADDESIHYYSYHEGGKVLLQPTAIQAWNGTKLAIRTIFGATDSNDDYLNQIIIGNMAISMLVTGMEVYCQRRFAEMEREGVPCDYEKLLNTSLSLDEIHYGKKKKIIADAETQNLPVSTIIIKKKVINFQNYDECKRAFNKGYHISFGKHLGISNKTLELLQDLISHRHRVIHVSPFESTLHTPKARLKDRTNVDKRSYSLIVETFDLFIQALHTATLKLK